MKSAVTDPLDNTLDDPTRPAELVLGNNDFTTLTEKVSDIVLERKTPLAWYVIPAAMLVLWLVGQIAVLGPARRASRV